MKNAAFEPDGVAASLNGSGIVSFREFGAVGHDGP